MCMLSLDRTDDDRFVGCLLARLIPKRRFCFSSLLTNIYSRTLAPVASEVLNETTRSNNIQKKPHIKRWRDLWALVWPSMLLIINQKFKEAFYLMHHVFSCIENLTYTLFKNKKTDKLRQPDQYLINKTESPAKSLFPLTNKLQPVVSKCLFGWPDVR